MKYRKTCPCYKRTNTIKPQLVVDWPMTNCLFSNLCTNKLIEHLYLVKCLIQCKRLLRKGALNTNVCFNWGIYCLCNFPSLQIDICCWNACLPNQKMEIKYNSNKWCDAYQFTQLWKSHRTNKLNLINVISMISGFVLWKRKSTHNQC